MDKTLKFNIASGKIRAVGSKSDAHRALICAALCKGETFIEIPELNADIEATAQCLTSLGATVDRTRNGYFIKGRAVGGGTLDCRESGSTARFLIPIAAALGNGATLIGSGKLPERPMLPLTEELRHKGCEVSADFLPLSISGALTGGRYVLPGNVSSQFISGLLMALPLTGQPSEIMMSTPLQSKLYADMTVKTLKSFGVNWSVLSESETEGYHGGYVLIPEVDNGNVCSACEPKKIYDTFKTCESYTVEGDWSGASFFTILAALCGDITICGLDQSSLQPDMAVADIAEKAGAECHRSGNELTVKKGDLRPFSVDVSQFPDIFPILAVLACGAKGETLLYNAGRLRIKESDRIETTAAMIRSLGGRVETGDDYMKIFGSGSLEGGTVDGAGDHRIVMSAAVAASICKGEVTIKGAEAVNKSFPTFFDVLASISKAN